MKNTTETLLILLTIVLATILTLAFMPPSPQEIELGIMHAQTVSEHLLFVFGKGLLIICAILVIFRQVTSDEKDNHLWY